MASEQPKKVTGGAFGQYLAENRAALLKELPGQRATAAVKLASERFKALNDVAKARYQKMYEAAKQKYEKDLAAFLSAGGEVKARKSKKDKKVKKSKDPNKPKKVAGGAFGCFLAKKRAEFMKEVGPGKAVTFVTRLASERWKQISDSEKRPFQKEYEEKVAQYRKAMETYVPPVVEEEEEEDEGDEGQSSIEEEEEDEGEEEDEEEEEERKKREKEAKKRKATSENDGPAAKKSKTAGSAETFVPRAVQEEAKKLGFVAKLKTLSENPKVTSSPFEILAELQKQNGSVVATKRALLGA